MDQTSQNTARENRETRQLHRLEMLMDVVYAIVIWRIFMILPRPEKGDLTWGSVGSLLSSNIESFVIIGIALLIVIIYWIQNNTLFGNLKRTDNRHTAISILQIFFLLLFLYSIRLGVVYEAGIGTRLMESITAALVGIASVMGWSYAIKNHRLLTPEISRQEVYELRSRILVEPTTAIITIPFAFIGPILWELAWFVYPLLVALIKRRRRQGG